MPSLPLPQPLEGRKMSPHLWIRAPPPPALSLDTIPWHGALHEALRDAGLGGGPPEVLLSPLPTPPTALTWCAGLSSNSPVPLLGTELRKVRDCLIYDASWSSS